MLVFKYPPDQVGGAERQCKLQASELVRQGHKCMVVTGRCLPHPPGKYSEQGVDVYRVGAARAFTCFVAKLGSWHTAFWRALGLRHHNKSAKPHEEKQLAPVAGSAKWMSRIVACIFMWNAGWIIWCNRKKIDVLHTHVASWNAGFAAWLGFRLGIPVVCKAANLPAFHNFEATVPFASYWRRWRLRCAYVALTEEMKEDLIREGVTENMVRILPNGVAIPELTAEVSSSKQVLFVGNFTQGSGHKSFDILLRSWALVSSLHPGWTLCLAGGGDFRAWEKFAEELNCRHSVCFAGRIENLSDVYACSAIVVNLSRREGISNALLEAQSHGLPAVASDIPGNRAVVIEAETGLLVPVGDIHQAAEALGLLMENSTLRTRLGLNARQRVEAEFDIVKVVQRLLGLYADLSPAGFMIRS
jgi:glycosyltransferase involved in cell wall biosynthesis